MSLWLFNVYIDAVMKEVKNEDGDGKEGKRVDITWPLVCR